MRAKILKDRYRVPATACRLELAATSLDALAKSDLAGKKKSIDESTSKAVAILESILAKDLR